MKNSVSGNQQANGQVREPKKGEKIFSASSKFVQGMGGVLKAVIKGQRYAIYSFQEAIFEALTVKDDRHKGPLISVVLSGLPGVGKTQLVQAVSEYLKLPYKRFNMSSYSDKEESLFNFKGINESYKSARRGDVTQFVDENPNAIILFDEVDKAHTNVMNCMLQILDEGMLEDGYTREKVSFKNCIVVMTTNVGAELFQDPTIYNYATLEKDKILRALLRERNPVTGYPCFSHALVSRFGQGRVIPFNRLDGQTLCEIAETRAQQLIDVFTKRYPDVTLKCDVKELAKTLLLEKGNNADARNMTGEVEHFFGSHLFDVMQKYAESGKDFAKLACVEFTFDHSGCEPRIQEMFHSTKRHKVAVYCGEDERELFQSREEVEFVFVDFKDRVNSLEFDGAIVSGDLQKNQRAMEYFRHIKTGDCLPVHVFTMDKHIDEIDMKIYYCEGAESVYIPKEGGKFEVWLNDIVNKLGFAQALTELARANLVVKNDTFCSFIEGRKESRLCVKTVNYRLERAVYAEDEGSVMSMHEIPSTRLSDVVGVDSAVEEVRDLVDLFANYKDCIRKGIRLPRGVLLSGVPGVGKTLLARAVAGECGLPFLHRNAANFFDKYVGGTQENIRKAFAQARRYAPCVIFIDEIDAIGKQRGLNLSSDAADLAQNTFLSEMDGFTHDDKKPVFVIAATNFNVTGANALDGAFVRRFDRRISLEVPNAQGRLDLFRYFLGKHKYEVTDTELQTLIERSHGKSPADLEQVVEFAVRQAKGGLIKIDDLEEAFERVAFGNKKEWSAEIVKKTSYHEAGHAVISCVTGKIPAYVTNVSRGTHGGYMQCDGEEDSFDYTHQELLDIICVSFGGRAAERLIYGESGLTSGASSDLKQARRFANAVFNDYGMDDAFLLGIGESEAMKRMMDEKVNALLQEQYARATKLLTENRKMLDVFTEALLKENSLTTKRINELLQTIDNKKEKQGK